MIATVYVAKGFYQDGKISLGEITSFIYYLLQLVFNFMLLSFVFTNVAAIMGASDKIAELMQYKAEINSRGG